MLPTFLYMGREKIKKLQKSTLGGAGGVPQKWFYPKAARAKIVGKVPFYIILTDERREM